MLLPYIVTTLPYIVTTSFLNISIEPIMEAAICLFKKGQVYYRENLCVEDHKLIPIWTFVPNTLEESIKLLDLVLWVGHHKSENRQPNIPFPSAQRGVWGYFPT